MPPAKYYWAHKEELQEKRQAYYAQDKDREMTRSQQRRAHVKAVLWAYKSARACCVCGYNESPLALDFHHNNPDKEGAIGRMKTYKLSRIMAEVEKCIVVCACCHRRIHHDGERWFEVEE